MKVQRKHETSEKGEVYYTVLVTVDAVLDKDPMWGNIVQGNVIVEVIHSGNLWPDGPTPGLSLEMKNECHFGMRLFGEFCQKMINGGMGDSPPFDVKDMVMECVTQICPNPAIGW